MSIIDVWEIPRRITACEAIVSVLNNTFYYLILADRTGHRLDLHWCIYRCHWMFHHRFHMWHMCCKTRQTLLHICTGIQQESWNKLPEGKTWIHMLFTSVMFIKWTCTHLLWCLHQRCLCCYLVVWVDWWRSGPIATAQSFLH